jgi:hypothetical protein
MKYTDIGDCMNAVKRTTDDKVFCEPFPFIQFLFINTLQFAPGIHTASSMILLSLLVYLLTYSI